MWGFFESEDHLQEKILARNIVSNIENDLLDTKLTIEKRERKIILLKCIKYFYSL